MYMYLYTVGDSPVEFSWVQCLGRLFSSLWSILMALVRDLIVNDIHYLYMYMYRKWIYQRDSCGQILGPNRCTCIHVLVYIVPNVCSVHTLNWMYPNPLPCVSTNGERERERVVHTFMCCIHMYMYNCMCWPMHVVCMCMCVYEEREMYMCAKYLMCIRMYHSTTPGTSQRMFLCYCSPLSRSPCWGCGSAPPPGLGLHSGWLSGSSLFTVLLVTRSIAMYYPLCLLHQYMQVRIFCYKWNIWLRGVAMCNWFDFE